MFRNLEISYISFLQCMFTENDMGRLAQQNPQIYWEHRKNTKCGILDKYEFDYRRTGSCYARDSIKQSQRQSRQCRNSSKKKRVPIFGPKNTTLQIKTSNENQNSQNFLNRTTITPTHHDRTIQTESKFINTMNNYHIENRNNRYKSYTRTVHGLLKPDDLALLVNQLRYKPSKSFLI